MEKVIIFIDGSNFYHSLKQVKNRTNMDFEILSKLLAGDRHLIRTYYYNSPVNREGNEEGYRMQQKFFDALRKIPRFEVKLGRLEKRKSDDGNTYYVEKGVDINIAVDMVHMAHNKSCDTIILISSDGDFAPAVKEVKEFGVSVENVCFKKSSSYHLKKVCDKTIYLDNLDLDSCFYQKT